MRSRSTLHALCVCSLLATATLAGTHCDTNAARAPAASSPAAPIDDAGTEPAPEEAEDGSVAVVPAKDAGHDAGPTTPKTPPTITESKLKANLAELVPIAENRVFQRAADGKSRIKVEVPYVYSQTKSMYLRLLDGSGASANHEEYFAGGSPKITITIPEGGPYKAELYQVDASNVAVSRHTSAVFGVGDVFVTAGQSNAANHGDFEFTPQEAFVMAMDYGVTPATWRKATDPQPVASKWGDPDIGSPQRKSGSPWPVFADAVHKKTGLPVGLVATAYSGSAASGWQPGGSWVNNGYTFHLYDRLVSSIRALGDCQFRAVLWHQGEAETTVGTPTNTYATQLRTMITQAKKDTGCAQPWMIAHVSYLPGKSQAQMDAVRAAQQQVIDDGTALGGPDTDVLVGAYRSLDTVHFSQSGLKKHGELWADEAIKAFFP